MDSIFCKGTFRNSVGEQYRVHRGHNQDSTRTSSPVQAGSSLVVKVKAPVLNSELSVAAFGISKH